MSNKRASKEDLERDSDDGRREVQEPVRYQGRES